MTTSAQFTNFTDKEFIGYWDGKERKFAPGQSDWMPDFLAKHFAKHLTNRELLRVNKNGQPAYKDGEKMTSPKFPEQVPQFMELFNKAYTSGQSKEIVSDKKDDINEMIDLANKEKLNKKGKNEKQNSKQDPKKPQVILPPDINDDDDESSFEGKAKKDN